MAPLPSQGQELALPGAFHRKKSLKNLDTKEYFQANKIAWYQMKFADRVKKKKVQINIFNQVPC